MRIRNKRVFLDYASTTPFDQEIFKKVSKTIRDSFYNASAFYKEGQQTSDLLEDARLQTARTVSVKPDEVIFTGSGTESDNLAILGLIKAIKQNDSGFFDYWKDKKPHIIVSSIEHPAILETCKVLESEDRAEVTYLPVLENGRIDISKLKNYIKLETVLISIILANNEIGVIQSIRNISGVIKKYKEENNRSFNEPPFLHTDASQAPCFLDINIDRLGAQMMTLDSSKFYGPKGVGCLIRKNHIPLSPIMFGGGQEGGFRPGTENVGMIIGFSMALKKAQSEKDMFSEKMKKIQDYFLIKIKEELEPIYPEIKINGSLKNRLPNNINICIPKINSEFTVIQLDELGVSCSSITACKNSSEMARSYVVDSLGYDCGSSSLRFSFGKDNVLSDVDFVISKLKEILINN